jgi:membrane fusion protein, heavy metal efflux system
MTSRTAKTATLPFLASVLLVTFAACSDGDAQDRAELLESLPGGSITLWTEKTELFMEHPALVVGMSGKFAVHLTSLSDFAPLRSGRITLRFEPEDKKGGFSVTQEEPRAPGIYGPAPSFPRSGVWNLSIHVESRQVKDVIEVPGLQVYARPEDVPAEVGEGAPGIAFLKEQQWKTPGFRTAFAASGSIEGSVPASGEITAAPGRLAEITAPVAGAIDLSGLAGTPAPGQRVSAKQTLALLLPALGENGSNVAEARRELREAEEEYGRARRLVTAEAIPERRLHEAEIRLDAARETIGSLGGGDGGSEKRIGIRSPIDGVVTDLRMQIGRRVEAGAPLLTVLDASIVWLRLDVPAGEASRVGSAARASFQVEGSERTYATNRLVSVGSVVDPRSRTVPLWLEVKNEDGALKVGSNARADVRTGEARTGVIIPRSAILDEDGRTIAYVQPEGESFAKRALEIGGLDGEQALVLAGIDAGERVVTGAAYQVRLASLSTSVPAHGHEH